MTTAMARQSCMNIQLWSAMLGVCSELKEIVLQSSHFSKGHIFLFEYLESPIIVEPSVEFFHS